MGYNKLVKLFISNEIYEDDNFKYRQQYHNNFLGPNVDYVAQYAGIDIKDKDLYRFGNLETTTHHSLKSILFRGIGDEVSMLAHQKETFRCSEGIKLTIIDISPEFNKLTLKINNFDNWKDKGSFNLITSLTNTINITQDLFELIVGQIFTFESKEYVDQLLSCLEIIEE